MKKSILIILSVLLVFIFAACNGAENTKMATPTPKATEAATPGVTPTPSPTKEPTPVPTAVPWADVDAILWNFKIDPDLSHTEYYIGITSTDAEVSYEEGVGLRVDVKGQDPFFIIDTYDNTLAGYNIEDYPILKIRILNKTVTKHGEIYAAFGSETIASGDQKYFFELQANATEYQDMYFDFTAKEGTISQLRFDLVNLTRVEEGVVVDYSEGYYVILEYAGFFKTMEEAQAYNLEQFINK